jgi:hypothetical protein
MYILHPYVINVTFAMFNCKSLDGSLYLQSDLEINCWDGNHDFTAKMLGIPSILVWIFGFPMLAFFLLKKNRNNLDEKKIIEKFGLYFVGVKDEVYYW